MYHITRWYKAGDLIFIKNYSARNYGAAGRKRKGRMRETPRAMSKYNDIKRSEKIQMLMLVNFDKGYHVTLDYPKDRRPQTYEEAENNLKKCLYKVSRRLKKKEQAFKYIAITERGKKAAALHHHLIIENKPEVMEELIRAWGNHIKFSRMYEEGAYKDLADYLCKIETKEELTKGKSKYHRSRNLKEPLQRTAFVEGPIKDDPFIPDKYALVPDSLINGFNELIGVRYQHYTVKKTCVSKGKAKKVQKCTKREHRKPKKKTVFSVLKSMLKKRRP